MFLTKSKFLIGLECPICFWKAMHMNIKNELSMQEEQTIMQGIEIGNLTKRLYSDCIDLSNMEYGDNIEATKNSLVFNKVIFEAGFFVDNMFARLDILVPNTDGSYDIIEVKSGTKVKQQHIYDVAFQKYVCERSGISVKHCYILHLNGYYLRVGELNLELLFEKDNVTNKVEEFYFHVPKIIRELTSIYNLPEAPELKANKYQFKEYPCQFDSECWSFLPKYNVSKLYKMKKSKVADLLRNNILSITEVPNHMLNNKQLIQKKTILENKPYINIKGIKTFIDKLQYPIYYLDFETFMEPIPRFQRCNVYAQIPFQYSLNIQYEDGRLEHYEFLHKDTADPRKTILLSIINEIGNRGSIVVFNQTFEKARLMELAELYPEYKSSVDRILERIVDLLVPFSSFDYYSPLQNGSCSIKKVLPAVTGESYEGMDISNGGDASTLYFKVTFENVFSAQEKDKIYSDLLKYCKLDTEGMVWIVDALKRIIV